MRSILSQSCKDWELLVVDDGSTDGTLEIAKEFSDSRIRVVAGDEHLGLPAQLNRAVQMAHGKYLARMDADDIAYPSRLEQQLAFLKSHPDVDLVGGSMAVFKNDGTLLGLRRLPASHAEICARPWAGFPMAHPTWMGRIEWFRQNPYRTDAVRMEDRELLFRTYSHSRFGNIPQVLLGYREDSLSLGKLLLARKNTCKLAVEYAREQRKFALAGRVIAGQLGRVVVETLALSTGIGYRILRHRALPPTAAEEEEWKRVWIAIHAAEKSESGGAPPARAAAGEAS
jgi:glycosyltransferase involved in cell wall biosynthesis